MRRVVVILIAFVVGILGLSALGFASLLNSQAPEVDAFSIPSDGIRCEVGADGAALIAIRIHATEDHVRLLDAKPPSSAPWHRDGVGVVTTGSADLPNVSALTGELSEQVDGFQQVEVETNADVVMRIRPDTLDAPLPGIRLYWTRGEPIYTQEIDAADIREACDS